jgi:hypothetical protein
MMAILVNLGMGLVVGIYPSEDHDDGEADDVAAGGGQKPSLH